MRYIKTVVIILVAIIALTSSVFAQETAEGDGQRGIAQVEYSSKSELDTIIGSATLAFDYFSGEGIDRSFVLGVFDTDTIESLEQQGLVARFIDAPHESIDRYVLMYSFEPDQGSLLQDLGEVFQLSKHHYLVKLPDGVVIQESDLPGGFFDLPLPEESIPTPIYQAETITRTPLPTEASEDIIVQQPYPPEDSNNKTPIIIALAIGLVLLGGVVVGFVVMRRRR